MNIMHSGYIDENILKMAIEEIERLVGGRITYTFIDDKIELNVENFQVGSTELQQIVREVLNNY